MAERKLFAGHAVRRVRRQAGLNQAAMAEMLGISASYQNLLERNQRPLTAPLLVRLAELFSFDPRVLTGQEPGGGVDAVRRRLADPMFADLEVDRGEVVEWLAAAPGGAEAFARVFDRLGGGGGPNLDGSEPVALLRREVERWRNHFADLDTAAEAIADELRLGAEDPYGALTERLRVRHGLSVRLLPAEVLGDTLRRLDLHARQLQLGEMLAPHSRTFAVATQLAQIELRAEIDALVKGAAFADRTAERLFRRHLGGYAAAAITMPYARFLRACEASGYDLGLLQRRFGAGYEQVAHRLTTLSRVGARGLSFFMLRVDRAGQVSKRYAGASEAALVEADGRCPLWRLHHAFDRPGTKAVQLVELEDGARWLTISRTVAPQSPPVGGVRADFSVALGIAAAQARGLAAARGIDLAGEATPIGLGCARCLRPACPQRSLPPAGRALLVHDRERRVSPLTFAGD